MGLRTLKAARTAHGVSQHKLGREIALSQPQLSLIESGSEIGILEALAAEDYLGEPINFRSESEPMTAEQAREVFRVLMNMSSRFPLRSLLTFTLRAINSVKLNEGQAFELITQVGQMAQARLMKGGT